MDETEYKYSIVQNIFSVILALGMNIFTLFMTIRFPALPASLILSALFLCTAVMTFYLCKKFFFPLLRGETALELDKEKLQFYITNRIIYWKDVKSIDYNTLNHGGWAIVFIMKDRSENIDISTKYIAGNDKDIYNSIVKHFEKNN